MPKPLLVAAVALAGAGAHAQDVLAPFDRVLATFVTPAGTVNYAGLKAHPQDLEAFLRFLATAPGQGRGHEPKAVQMAFWINAYNALTLKTIVDNYPIRPRGLKALVYPASSIRQIPGAWTDRRWRVAGRLLSLDDIEHRILRPQFGDPRVHMALVCAAAGCPPLRREAYRGEDLESQLDDQARRYLASPAGLRVDPQGREVAVSSIFKWFEADFGGPQGVRAFLRRYAPAPTARLLSDPTVSVTFIEYDWRLNDAQGGKNDQKHE